MTKDTTDRVADKLIGKGMHADLARRVASLHTSLAGFGELPVDELDPVDSFIPEGDDRPAGGHVAFKSSPDLLYYAQVNNGRARVAIISEATIKSVTVRPEPITSHDKLTGSRTGRELSGPRARHDFDVHVYVLTHDDALIRVPLQHAAWCGFLARYLGVSAELWRRTDLDQAGAA